MPSFPDHCDTDVMMKTEDLLREAQAICLRVTKRQDVSDELLCSVFHQLQREQDLAGEGDEIDAEVINGLLH